MSLDNFQLPPTVIQSLYSKSLYDLHTNQATEADKPPEQISFLGSNQKKIAILVNAAESIYLPDDELNFLLGILTACKLSMADIALINVSKNQDLDYTTITEQLKAEKIFLFGLLTESLELPLQFPHYQVQNFNNQVYLSSKSLDDLQKDKAEKLKLWNCLKNIFSL
ncbi:MAG: hypothetical protein IPL84_09405 [Chitinophagaceae bacterium]|nr:hypothetical protein [Chitinophagaceae bacterium]